jgi:hypothetical protein
MTARPNVKKLARKQRFEGLAAALRYHDWAQLTDGSYVDLGIVVRRDAISALAASEDPRAADAISRALNDGARAVRLAAVTALRDRREPVVAPALASAYLSSDATGDEATRSAALDALSAIPMSTAAPLVRAVVERHGDRYLNESEHALLGALAGGGEQAEQLTVAALVDALGHGRPTAQERAVQGLVGLGSASVPALIEAMDDEQRRARAAVALGRCGDGRAVEALIGLLADGDPAVRRAAAETLGELRDPRSAEALLAAARDESHETRVAAASALDRLGSAGLLVEIAGMSRQAPMAEPTDDWSQRLDPPIAEPTAHWSNGLEPPIAEPTPHWSQRLGRRLRGPSAPEDAYGVAVPHVPATEPPPAPADPTPVPAAQDPTPVPAAQADPTPMPAAQADKLELEPRATGMSLVALNRPASRTRRVRPWAIIGLMLGVFVVAGVAAALLLPVASKKTGNKTILTTPAALPVTPTHRHRRHRVHRPIPAPVASQPSTVRLQLVPTGRVYVCLVDGTGRTLIPGLIFSAGQTIPTETARKMRLTLGSVSVHMKVNGSVVNVASSPSLGFLLKPGGHSLLPLAQQPTCAGA